jgi:uroporphyrinogen-III decarboxylase
MKHIGDFASIMHAHGKKAVVHMCGHLKALLDEIKETGIDGIHALTGPPVGTCSFENALDVLGEDLIIIGTLDPHIFLNQRATPEDIRTSVKSILTDRIKECNFIVCAGADGIPTPIWKYDIVRETMEKYGVRH